MSFTAYSEYKDSGIQWIGKVPSDWKLGRLKHLLRIRGGQDYKTVESSEPTEFPVIGSGGRFTFATDYLYDGESVLLGRKGTIDKPLYVNGKFWTVDTMFYTEILPSTSGRYAYYAATTIPFSLYSTSTALPSMSQFDLANHALPLPNFQEQTQIARFLDHETARIDALIEEQRRLIELLKEKRQAVISHAVTKGLDPDVPMKDSSVEWLGEVPEHWKVVRVKHVKSSQANAFVDGPFGSNLKSEHFVDNGDAYVIESNFATTGELKSTELKEITNDHFQTIRRSETQGGDIIIAKIGARYGMCSILPSLDKPAVVSGNSLKLTVNKDLCDARFVVYVLRHLRTRGAIEDIVNMTAQPALSLGEMNNLPFPLPPLNEQKDIIFRLEKEIAAFESLSSDCKQMIDVAKERRSALISAAVTGKIDVRNWQPDQLSAANTGEDYAMVAEQSAEYQ